MFVSHSVKIDFLGLVYQSQVLAGTASYTIIFVQNITNKMLDLKSNINSIIAI